MTAKTSTELAAELEILQKARAEANTLASSLGVLQSRLTHQVAAHTISGDDRDRRAVAATQQAIDEAIEAATRRAVLDDSIGQTKNLLDHQIGVERRQHCQNIRDQFRDTHADYVEAGKKTLALLRELQRLSTQHTGLTGQGLLDAQELSMNIPALNGPGQFIPTARA